MRTRLPGKASAKNPAAFFNAERGRKGYMEINYWDNIYDVKKREGRTVYTIATFMDNIANGRWKAVVDEVRGEKDEKTRHELKLKLPQVTPSGVFSYRNEAGLVKHSGYILLDFDGLNDAVLMQREVIADKYVAGTFISSGGNGLAVWIKIDPNRHDAAFAGLEKYFYDNYGLVADVARRSPASTRAVSYDPNAEFKSLSEVFDRYLPKAKEPKRYATIPCTKSDVGKIVAQINMDIAVDYPAWIKLGASLATLGEAGREFFHACSQYSEKYDRNQCDKKFDNLLNTANGAITIGTFYHIAEKHGYKTNREKPKCITKVCKELKRKGREVTEAIERLGKMRAIVPGDKEDAALVEEVFEETEAGVISGIAEVIDLIADMCPTKNNLITGKLEHATTGKEITDMDLSAVYVAVKEEIETARKADVLDVLKTNAKDYHPIKDFIEANRHIETGLPVGGLIAAFSETIKPVMDAHGSYGAAYIETFLTKWLIGMAAGIYGHTNPLMLALVGRQGSGKSEFFRRLLPPPLRQYMGEPSLSQDKDTDIQLCEKLIIMDDELAGKNRVENMHLKAMLTRGVFTVRRPYAVFAENRQRLASLCGTGNESDILTDFGGNRRIVPIEVQDIDKRLYNSIDKTALFMDAVRMFEAGYRWELTGEEVALLGVNTEKHKAPDSVSEILNRYYRVPDEGDNPVMLTVSDIMIEIAEKTKVVTGKWWTSQSIGRTIKRIGFPPCRVAHGARYKMVRKERFEIEANQNENYM